MLTGRMREAFEAIDRRTRNGGLAPTCEELCSDLGVRSKASAARLLNALEERGFIRRLPHRARGIEVIRRPALAPNDPARELRAYLDARHGPGFTAALLAARPGGPVEFIHLGRRYNTHPEAEHDGSF